MFCLEGRFARKLVFPCDGITMFFFGGAVFLRWQDRASRTAKSVIVAAVKNLWRHPL
jgi:hypothetical protein